MDEILLCDHSVKSFLEVISGRVVCVLVVYKM